MSVSVHVSMSVSIHFFLPSRFISERAHRPINVFALELRGLYSTRHFYCPVPFLSRVGLARCSPHHRQAVLWPSNCTFCEGSFASSAYVCTSRDQPASLQKATTSPPTPFCDRWNFFDGSSLSFVKILKCYDMQRGSPEVQGGARGSAAHYVIRSEPMQRPRTLSSSPREVAREMVVYINKMCSSLHLAFVDLRRSLPAACL